MLALNTSPVIPQGKGLTGSKVSLRTYPSIPHPHTPGGKRLGKINETSTEQEPQQAWD